MPPRYCSGQAMVSLVLSYHGFLYTCRLPFALWSTDNWSVQRWCAGTAALLYELAAYNDMDRGLLVSRSPIRSGELDFSRWTRHEEEDRGCGGEGGPACPVLKAFGTPPLLGEAYST
eukprot:TRINITY_DN5368_c0_g1_i3.p2 TRINITY_DN5368_c0_g1~~TRINITY_DN5368_c0_g1_i3.p2  ORF type:complete len:117 (+),score=1.20 TRINITY_DN5368_c0_g1_i3:328-678(+)